MYKAPVFTAEGERTGERELPESLFDGVVHEPAMWQTVKAYLSNQRRPNATVKNRSAVAGGGSKPWRQKGTGRARQGTIRAAQWRGGGVVFGPGTERNYRQEVPKKVRRLARRSAFNARAESGALFVIEPLRPEEPRTKAVARLLAETGAGANVLILTDGVQAVLYRSARNIPRVRVRAFGTESAYDVLWADTVLLEAPALEAATEQAGAAAAAGEPAEPAAEKPAKPAARKKPAAKTAKESGPTPKSAEETKAVATSAKEAEPAEEAVSAEDTAGAEETASAEETAMEEKRAEASDA